MRYIIGVDEVGRGPLAGPVTVAAVLIPVNFKETEIQDLKFKLKDSKKLSPKKREYWFSQMKKLEKRGRIFCSVSSVSQKKIDKINISNAANLAATKAVVKVLKNSKKQKSKCIVFLDGGLHLMEKNNRKIKIKSKTIIKGDEKIHAISMASIFAKVTRDKLMNKVHKKYPKYGFSVNKGYGTKFHIKAILTHGFSDYHRLTFLERIVKLK